MISGNVSSGADANISALTGVVVSGNVAQVIRLTDAGAVNVIVGNSALGLHVICPSVVADNGGNLDLAAASDCAVSTNAAP